MSLVDRGSGGLSFDGVDTDTAFALGELGGLNTFSTFVSRGCGALGESSMESSRVICSTTGTANWTTCFLFFSKSPSGLRVEVFIFGEAEEIVLLEGFAGETDPEDFVLSISASAVGDLSGVLGERIDTPAEGVADVPSEESFGVSPFDMSGFTVEDVWTCIGLSQREISSWFEWRSSEIF